MKKLLAILFTILCISTLTCCIVACSDNDDAPANGDITVTYDSQGGSAITADILKVGEKITPPSAPIKQGYTFNGWYTEAECITAWDFITRTVTENITLYAKWIIEEGKILSMSNAEISDYDILMIVDETVEYVPLSESVYLGGNATWKLYYDKTGQTEIPTKIAAQTNGKLNSGDNVFYILTRSADEKQVRTYTLTVHRQKSVTVRFYGNGTLLGYIQKNTRDTVSVSDISDIKQNGYTINGWTDEDGNAFIIGETLLTADINVNSVVSPNTYTVTFDAQKGTMNTTSQEVTFDSIFALEIPQKIGFNFLYWYTLSETGTETRLTDSDGQSLETYSIPNDIIVYAKWETKRYLLILNSYPSGGGRMLCNGIAGTEFSIAYNESVTVTADTASGYTFLGIFDVNKKLNAERETSFTFNMPAENKTINAKWYKIDIVKNIEEAGSVSLPQSKYFVGDEATVTATTNDGYVFDGWYDGETKVCSELAYTFAMPEQNKTYTAKWSLR